MLCPLSAEHPHFSLDVPLEGNVELVLVPVGSVTNKQVTAHVVGQRVGAESNDNDDSSEQGIDRRGEDSGAIESRKRARPDSLGVVQHEEEEEEMGDAKTSQGEESRESDDAMEDILEPQTGTSSIVLHDFHGPLITAHLTFEVALFCSCMSKRRITSQRWSCTYGSTAYVR